jgi:type II secretory pathway pseudopilin PulG
MTLVEVIVAMVLIAVFSASLLLSMGAATRASADNRARIGAAGLAQRELALAGEMIHQAGGSGAALVASTAVNPHLDASVAGSDPGSRHPFTLDGQSYRVERSAQLRSIKSESCPDPSTSAGRLMSTLVTVSVTWAGMRPASRPHTVSKLFPPAKGSEGAIPKGSSLVVVRVKGLDDGAAGSDRAGVRVSLAGPGGGTMLTTDAEGCAFTYVKPPPAGADYTVQLLRGPGGAKYVSLAGVEQPIQPLLTVVPDTSRLVTFDAYDLAGEVSVEVEDPAAWDPPLSEVGLLPSVGGAGGRRNLPFDGGTVLFEGVYPGVYSVVGATASQTVKVERGGRVTAKLVAP